MEELKETLIYKKFNSALNELYVLEDITQYKSKEIAEAIDILQNVDVHELIEENCHIKNTEIKEK
jgi:hypothetical protein